MAKTLPSRWSNHLQNHQFQDGQGNAARTLRVEGKQKGIHGYFFKRIFDKQWKFQPTQLAITEAFLIPEEPLFIEDTEGDTKSPHTEHLETPEIDTSVPLQDPVIKSNILYGSLQYKRESLSFQIHNFDMICSPARLLPLYNGEPIRIQGSPLSFEFHHVHTLVSKPRPIEFWKKDIPAKIRGAIIPNEDIQKIEDPEIKAKIINFFGDVSVINFVGTATDTSIQLKEMSIWNLFGAPNSEKGWNSRYRLSASPTK